MDGSSVGGLKPRGSAHARAVTRGPRYHWFGYYDKCPWSADGRLMLAMEVDFMDRVPTGDDSIRIGVIDLEAGTGEFHALDETRAWCWQQGTMLQWLATDPNRLIIYNSVEDGQYVSVIRDVHSGETRIIPRPVYAVSPDGTQAVSLNFARTGRCRPGYGYRALPDPTEGVMHPDDDGIWQVDLRTGETRLIVTIDQVTKIAYRRSMESENWFNHMQFCTDGSRFLWLHRWYRPGSERWFTRLFTATPDGSDIYLVADDDMVSHFDWRDERHILAWATHRQIGDRYFLFRDQSPWFEVVGPDVFTCDGHCSYSPDPARRYILTDTYPDARSRRWILLYDTQTGRRADLGCFLSPRRYAGEIRCDLHPRWSRDGRQICFDSLHEGERQLYVLDISEIVQYP